MPTNSIRGDQHTYKTRRYILETSQGPEWELIWSLFGLVKSARNSKNLYSLESMTRLWWLSHGERNVSWKFKYFHDVIFISIFWINLSTGLGVHLHRLNSKHARNKQLTRSTRELNRAGNHHQRFPGFSRVYATATDWQRKVSQSSRRRLVGGRRRKRNFSWVRNKIFFSLGARQTYRVVSEEEEAKS